MTKIDTEHPVMLTFEAVGYRPEDLRDPSEVTVEEIKSGGWRAIKWGSVGVEMFDVGPEHLDEDSGWSPSDVAVDVGVATQPIDLETAVFSEIKPMKHLRAAADPIVLVFAPPEAERDYSVLDDERTAVEALSLWGHRGYVPRATADRMIETFGGDLADRIPSNDPDADGAEIVRSRYVASAMVDGIGETAESADSGISGHDQRDRQVFYRNLDVLKEHVGLDGE